MILPFSTQLNGKPTYFVEKIWKGLLDKRFHEEIIKNANLEDSIKPYPIDEDIFKSDLCIPKLHSIRTDEKNRWKEGNIIDFYINNRTKNALRFAPRIPVVSTQEIFMTRKGNLLEITIADVDSYIGGNDKYMYYPDKEKLAINDGFSSYSEFAEYFGSVINKNGLKTGNYWFSGKIIHWTDLKY